MSALCARLARLGLKQVEVAQEGPELVLRAPRRLEADARAATMPGKLNFYDWDSNVVGRSGPDAPFSGETALFDAVEAASQMKPRAEATDVVPGDPPSPEEADRGNDTAAGALYYLFGTDRRPIGGPASSPGALATARGGAPAGARVLKVPRGIVVIEAKRSPQQTENAKRYFVLEDDAELSRPDVTSPRLDTNGVTHEPILTMQFTEEGRMAFAALTRRIAERGGEVLAPPGSGPGSAPQRLAIVLDDRLVSLATIDSRETPAGLDGRTGAQISGVGTLRQVRRLALRLSIRPLPGSLVPLTKPPERR